MKNNSVSVYESIRKIRRVSMAKYCTGYPGTSIEPRCQPFQCQAVKHKPLAQGQHVNKWYKPDKSSILSRDTS